MENFSFLSKDEQRVINEILKINIAEEDVIEYSLEEINSDLKYNRLQIQSINFSLIEKINKHSKVYYIQKRPLTNFFLLIKRDGYTPKEEPHKQTHLKSDEVKNENVREIELIKNKILEHENRIKELEYEVKFLKSKET